MLLLVPSSPTCVSRGPAQPERRPWEPDWRVWRPALGALVAAVVAAQADRRLGPRSGWLVARRRSPAGRWTPRCRTARACASTGSDGHIAACPRATRSTTPRAASAPRWWASRSRRSRPRSRATRMDRWPERLDGRAVRRGRPRQAPLPALRGRPHAPLAPPHGRGVGGVPARPALAAQPAPRVARDPHAGARGGAVRRPGARADDRRPHALRPAARALGPDVLAAEFDEAASSAACARTTRAAGSATPCSTSATSPASGTSGRPRAASSPGSSPWRPLGEVSDERGARDRRARSGR